MELHSFAVRNECLTVFIASLCDIDKAIEAKNLNEYPLEEIVPELYSEFLPLCSEALVDQLLPHQHGINYAVCLK